MREQAVWATRFLWFLLPLTIGQAASQAISDADHNVPLVMTAGLWALWAAGLLAASVPTPTTLTALRVLAAGLLPLAAWTIIDDTSTLRLVGLAHAIATVFVAMNSLVGDRFVDGGSYGDERRMPLRPPTIAASVLSPVVTLFVIAAMATGPLLLANRSWLVGGVALLVGAGVVAGGLRALHQLSQRWIVFVPTGMVLHDPQVLTEPVLFRRTAIERLGAAIAGTPARDLSNKAAGLLIECELTDPAPLGLRDLGTQSGASLTDVRRFLFCPSRPGALLDEAQRRNIATDGATSQG